MSSTTRPLLLLPLLTLLSAVSAQDDAFQSILESHNLAGMSVVTRCGDALSIEAHVGQRDIGRDLPVNGNTTYRMASISKAVVALAKELTKSNGYATTIHAINRCFPSS